MLRQLSNLLHKYASSNLPKRILEHLSVTLTRKLNRMWVIRGGHEGDASLVGISKCSRPTDWRIQNVSDQIRQTTVIYVQVGLFSCRTLPPNHPPGTLSLDSTRHYVLCVQIPIAPTHTYWIFPVWLVYIVPHHLAFSGCRFSNYSVCGSACSPLSSGPPCPVFFHSVVRHSAAHSTKWRCSCSSDYYLQDRLLCVTRRATLVQNKKTRLRSPRDGRVPTIAKDSLRHHRLYATPACHGAFTLCHWAPDRQKSIPWTVTLSWLPRAYSRLLFVGRWLWPAESVRLTKFWCAIRVH